MLLDPSRLLIKPTSASNIFFWTANHQEAQTTTDPGTGNEAVCESGSQEYHRGFCGWRKGLTNEAEAC